MTTTAWRSWWLMAAIGLACITRVAAVEAATITVEHTFEVATHDVFAEDPNEPDGVGNSERVQHFLSDFPPVAFSVPAFDPSLGTLSFLRIEVDALLSISGSVQFGNVFGHIDIEDPQDPISLAGEVGVFALCPAACSFSNSTAINIGFDLANGPFDFNVAASHDRFVTWEVAASGVVDTSFTGMARYIYTYDPVPPTEPIPEPSSLLLLASGLALGARRLRARRS